ncbi:unnamed protein product [Amoebophrya sp. A120]|nr:unnamed protein product [Amoebophrya sp. A120]|eukprot:GSA120T00007854001.1
MGGDSINAQTLSNLTPEEFTTPMLCYVVKKTSSAGTEPPPDADCSAFSEPVLAVTAVVQQLYQRVRNMKFDGRSVNVACSSSSRSNGAEREGSFLKKRPNNFF